MTIALPIEIKIRDYLSRVFLGYKIVENSDQNVVIGEISNYWLLLLAVFIGGQLGNFLNLKVFPTRILALVTAGLVLFVAIRIGVKLFL